MKCNLLPQDLLRTQALAGQLHIPLLAAQLLLHRGLDQPDQVRDFISPALSHLPSPDLMKDMDQAVLRILEALRQKEHIAIFGDYDADGLTATALLVHFLT